MSDSAKQETADVEAFIRLLALHERALTMYVVSLVPSSSDAQDILQETKIALWRSMDSFEMGSNFGAWARKTAFYRILDYRKRKGREKDRLCFTDKCYELLSQDYEARADALEERREKLRDCIVKLSPRHREILTLRYFRDASVEEVATRVSRSVDATYRVLSRIRLALRTCINSKQMPSL